MEYIQGSLFGKMYPEPFPATEGTTSRKSSRKSAASATIRFQYLDLRNGNRQGASWVTGSPLPGASSMQTLGAYPSAENASILSDILLATVPEKYYLSRKACLGILQRASARGKELPAILKAALEKQAAVSA